MNELDFLQRDISSNTIFSAKEILKSVEAYMNSFDRKEFLSFSSKTDAEKYSKNYQALLSSISTNIPPLISENARLASLLVKADRAMSTDIIVLCEKRFNAFEAFEQELNKYMSAMENIFANGKPNPSFLLNSAMQFKIALNALIEANL